MKEEKRNIPEVRFREFAGDNADAWEQRKLGDVADIVGGGTPSTKVKEYWNGNINWYSPVEIGTSIYTSESVKKITQLGLEKSSAKILPKGTVLFTSRAGIGNTAILTKEATTNQGFQSIVPKKELLNSYFIFTETPFLKRYGEINGAGSTFVEVSGKQMSKMPLLLPSFDEQLKIGNFFKQLDSLISLHQRELDNLKVLKKTLLSKMFPKNDEKYPEIRFSGFTDAWELRKLGGIGKVKSGVGFPNSEQGGKTGIPFFKVSDMNRLGNENELINADNYVTEEQVEHKKWKVIDEVPAIIFAKVGAAIMLNRKRIAKYKFLMDNNVMAYSFSNCWDTYFGKSLFETIFLPKYAQVGALPSYNSSDIESINVRLPGLQEQEKIGTFFKHLDELITLHQRELDDLKVLKKTLLSKMFV